MAGNVLRYSQGRAKLVDNYFSVDDKSEFIGCIDVIEAVNTVTTFTTLDIHNSYRLVT